MDISNWGLFFLRWGTILLDLFLVYFLVYRLFMWVRDTHAFALIRGIFWIVLLYVFSFLLDLTTISWILGKLTTVMILLLIIIFQPELRRFLERLGSVDFFFSPLLSQSEAKGAVFIRQLLRAIEDLSKQRVGALIVVELSQDLSEYMASGIKINGLLSSELLTGIFATSSPTHDGAVIIRENRIEAAGCLLPLTESKLVDRRLGTRHRAALGLSECSDALVFVVSEETGVVSLAEHATLTRYMSREAMEARLFNLYRESGSAAVKNRFNGFWGRWLSKER